MRVILAAAWVLAACVPANGAGQLNGLADHMWLLSKVDGGPAGYSASLQYDGTGRISGEAPCNRYFANLEINGAGVVVGPVGATRRACLHMQGEAAYFEMLQAVTEAEVREGQLILRGAGHEMRFIPPVE